MYSLYWTAFICNQKWRADREAQGFFFLTDNHKLHSQEVFAVTQQNIFDAFVFMSYKTIVLQTAGAADWLQPWNILRL